MKQNVFYSKMALFEDTVEELAEHLGITRQTLTQKIIGESEFKRDEMDKIITRYKLTPEDTHEIFFSRKEK